MINMIGKASALFCTAALVACSPPEANSDVYTTGQAQQAAQVERGKIISVRDVVLKDRSDRESETIGATVGAVIGGVLGNQVGGGDGRKATTVAGAGVGALAGSQIAKANATAKAQEYIVKKANGQTIAIVQQGTVYSAGQRINIITRGGVSRISG
ncbi:glycine zipper 2TM domain-containing protein [Amylibacter sp. SFDW26]|uniref:glycine zipper 2TM domain-containing protein n=1 Tax=Amylibacter sp. SFDW26 TaxID=2652722 RepID=UPI001261AEB6|nr:glycine zipper 2TM domain-containing protein [Amylibacter sp. SFDW26]KAB7614577.1 glycine zipper 2TM domain-containing protein [Amylibacter sp. SFDW26]